MNKLKSIAYLLATSLAMMEGGSKENVYQNTDIQKPPRRTCKDCYFYTGGTFCKRVKHHVNKQTPVNGCAYFKTKYNYGIH